MENVRPVITVSRAHGNRTRGGGRYVFNAPENVIHLGGRVCVYSCWLGTSTGAADYSSDANKNKTTT